jgi:hypothetical protein
MVWMRDDSGAEPLPLPAMLRQERERRAVQAKPVPVVAQSSAQDMSSVQPSGQEK